MICMPLDSTPRTYTATMTFHRVPSPPFRATPASTPAVMPSNSMPGPLVPESAEPERADMRMAAMPTSRPAKVNTRILIFFTFRPARRAASGLSPAA